MSDQILSLPEATTTTQVPSREAIAVASNEKITSSAHTPRTRRRAWTRAIDPMAYLAAGVVGIPSMSESMNTVSTDDAYVYGHVIL